jgi:PAS domain-containing protein
MNPDLNSQLQDAIAAESDLSSARELQLEAENMALKESLRRNFSLFEAILSSGRDGVALTGPDRRIVRVFKGLTGVDKNSFSGHLVELLAVPEDTEIVVDAYRRLLAGGTGKVQFIARFPRADGTLGIYSVTLTDMLDNPDVRGIIWNYSESAEIRPGPLTSAGDLVESAEGSNEMLL